MYYMITAVPYHNIDKKIVVATVATLKEARERFAEARKKQVTNREVSKSNCKGKYYDVYLVEANDIL